MKITLRNPERRQWCSGYGVINRELAPVCDSIDDHSAEIHLFLSPPYSFAPLDPAKYNVGLTMVERADLDHYTWPNGKFVDLANAMDLIITVGDWNKAVMQQGGVTTPIEVASLGHRHSDWYAKVRDGRNRKALILDRGRDHGGGTNILLEYFEDITHLDCKTPKPTSEANKEAIKKGRYAQEELRRAYQEADVFFKWGREGWGFPILEAMSAGCLVITNCVHLPYLRPNVNCLTFRDVPQLRNALNHAARSPYTDIKRAGQETASQLTWEQARAGVRDAILRHAREKV